MMTTRVLDVGAALRAYLGTKLNRPAVVLRRAPIVNGVQYVLVATGTTVPPKPHETRYIFIDSSHPDFLKLGLTAPTWFKDKTSIIKENDDSIDVIGECPPPLLISFFRLCGLSV